MKINDFIKDFVDQLDETDISELTPATNFRQLEEWSSLNALAVHIMINKKYGKLSSEEMQKANTIQELFDIIN